MCDGVTAAYLPWTQGAAVNGLDYLCLFVASRRCPDTERLPLRAFAHIIELSVGRPAATDGSARVSLSKIKACWM